MRIRVGPTVAVAGVVAAGVLLVVLTLREPDVRGFSPTPAAPAEAGTALVGPVLYTIDARAPEAWRYFSFRVGSVVDGAGPRDWDLGFRRFQVIANGGSGYLGDGAIRDLGEVPFDTVRTLPRDGYAASVTRPDPSNPAIARWYRYGFFSHRLTPKPNVWAVRTADGRYAKMEIVSYYCTGGEPGCFTFRYVYQGNGSTAVASRPGSGCGPARAACAAAPPGGSASAGPGRPA